MLQHNKPEDFVIATGKQHTVRQFCELAFKSAGINIKWEGEGKDEKGICRKTRRILIKIDSKYYRPSEVQSLLGDPTKAKILLGWDPQETSFEKLVEIMVKSDLKFVVNKLSLNKLNDKNFN